MACINKSLPAYQDLKRYFGQSLADSLVRSNNMNIPGVNEAEEMIKGNKVLQFKRALNYLRTTTSASIDDLIAAMPRILQKKGAGIYVLKGSRLSEKPSFGAELNIQLPHLTFLNEVNKSFGKIFNISQYHENAQAAYVRRQILTSIANLENEPAAPMNHAREWAIDPEKQDELFKALTDQIQTGGYSEETIRSQFGDEIADMLSDYIAYGGTKQIKAGSRLFNTPNPETATIAQQYKDDHNIDVGEGERIYAINVEYAKKIADAYEEMEHNPNDPLVKAAYDALVDETIDQFTAITKAGYKVEIYQGEGEPYKNSEAMIADLTYNKHMYILGTNVAYGTENNIEEPSELKKELVKAGAVKKLVDAVPNDTKLRKGLLGDNKRIIGSLLGLQGYYSSSENVVSVGTFLTSLLGGKNELLIHEGVHAATVLSYYDILEHPQYYNKDQIDAVNDLENIAQSYIGNTPKYINEALDYGLTNSVEFIAEFVSNKDFRKWVGQNNPNEKISILKYIWEKILTLLGLNKKEINQDIISKIEKGIDALYDISVQNNLSKDNPLLTRTNVTDVNGKKLVVNDLFRFIHDFFGHSERGNGFGAVGEENAWDVHARMYTPLARRAMTTETRGQNSWVNFGKHMRNEDGSIKTKNDPGYLSPTDRPFADQKIGLMPEEFSALPEELGQERTGTKIADGTYRVSVDEQKLADLVEENKKNPQQIPFVDNMPDEEYQKKSGTSFYWQDEQEKRFTVENLVRMLNKKFGIQFDYINDSSQKWAGKFKNGKITLNLANLGIDTAFHEIAHPFAQMLKSENPELYNNLIEELKNSEEGKAILEQVAKDYADLSPEEQLDEALVELIGRNASETYLNNPEDTTKKKSILQRFWDWVKDKLFNMGWDASTFRPDMRIRDIANMITNPMFSIDLSKVVDLNEKDEYYQRKSSQQMQRDFDSLINDTIDKLKADSNIAGKTETEKKRKFFSGKQVQDLINDRKNINALNSFITSGLFNLKDINDRFDTFIQKYESKKNRSKEDIRELSLLLNEIEDNITLYSNAGPLMESIFEMFPDEKDNFSDWAYSLKREKRLLNDYQSWGVNVVADWLFPYQKKAIRQALASNKIHTVVSKEVYDNEVKLAAEEGITDKNQILERAVKQEIKNTLLIAKRDASGITGYLAGVLNSRDSIASSVGQAVMDELHKALTYGHHVEKKFKKLMKQYRGTSLFTSNSEEKQFYQKYLRKAKVWTYLGLDETGKAKYEYREHTSFHEEYEWDTFYNSKREFFEKLGPAPTKTNVAAFQKWKAARDIWFSNNTILSKDKNGKDVRIPSSKYKNATFAGLQGDELFKEMYNTYKTSNSKLGNQGLKFGIVPQQRAENLVNKDAFKPRNALEAIRGWIGEQEQVYFVQSIAGGEKPIIPISHVRLLDEKELSYNFIDSVSKFAASAAKYESMSMIEPQVQILKNFIGGNNALNIKKRRTIQRSASGIKALSKGIHDDMFVESTKLNRQLNSFLNDAVYGQSMKKDVVQMWDSKFEVFKTNDKSNNGGPQVERIHGFENVREFTGLNDLDYSGFDFGKPRKVGEWTIKMTKKDWNFSVKKTADRLGLLTALQTMIVNPISSTVNVIRGKTEAFVEGLGGRYYNMKDYAFGEKEYFKALGSGDFFEDLKGGKPSFLSSMLIEYDAIQGELQDATGRKLERGLANKFFRTRHLFLAQNGGEHYIQTGLMISMMNHQKVKLNGGGVISLYEAKQREFKGQLKLSDTNWGPENDREFRERLAEVNTRLNGNYNKVDKAMIQRTWWGSALMMFRKHIYNGLANRYRKGYVNYQTGDYTEGYWRTFANGLIREIGEVVRDRNITKFSLNEQEKYAFKKFGGDVGMLALFIMAFKMFDDDDDDNEFNDFAALVARRLVSESGQYTPIIAPLEAGKMVKNPSAISYTVNNFYEAFKQTLSDPSEPYERDGPGYKEGENKYCKKWQRAIPGWRIVLNTQEPERLLQFYQQNSLGFLKPSAGKENEEDTE